MKFDVRYATFGALGLCLISALGSFIAASANGGILSLIAGLLSLAGGATAVLLYKYGYFIIPLITSKSKIVQVLASGHEIPPAQDVILKQVGGIYYASMFLGVKMYESTTEKSHEENVIYSEYFERAISSVRFPVKFSMMVYVVDMNKHRLKWETMHAEAQLRLAREKEKPDPDVLKMDRFEKEVAMCEAHLNRLISGFKPMGAISYVMTTATGVSKEAATAAVKNRGNELKATVSNALNVQVVPLQGDEMLKCFDWEHMIPTNASGMETAAL